MSPRTKEDFKQIRDEKRKLIIETALRLFALNSFRGTSIDQIAKEAGISKGLIYNYFESKDELLFSIFQFYFDELPELFKTKTVLTNPIDLFKSSIEKLVSDLESNPEHWTLFYILSYQFLMDKGVKEKFADQDAAIVNTVIEVLRLLNISNYEFEAFRFVALFHGAIISFLYEPNFPIRTVLMTEVNRYCNINQSAH
ncbi:TetR/AcrR family transcriptional regulator [bacterium]|nr:MAG: TetR/AcrR family transcriptional regulator [bacterium]